MHVPLKYYFRYTAYAVSLIVKEMHRAVKARKLYVHCIGHSLGAQTCGLSGKDLIQLGGSKLKYDRISGLDPAGPGFTNDVSCTALGGCDGGILGFWRNENPPGARLGPNDADFVDVIHTDGYRRHTGGVSMQVK